MDNTIRFEMSLIVVEAIRRLMGGQPPARWLESLSKPRLSTGSDFFFQSVPTRSLLVLWVSVRVRVSLGVTVRVSVEVRARVRVSNLLGSG